MRKVWVSAGLIVVGLLVLSVILVPSFLEADAFRPTVESQLTSLLGREVSLGRMSFSLLSGTLVADDLSIADDPAFSTIPFLQAKKIDVGVKVGDLVLHRQVHITRLIIESPSILLIHGDNGKWNFSSLGGPSSSPNKSPSPSAPPDLTIGLLHISGGSASISSLPVKGLPFVYSDVNVTVKEFSFTAPFPFELAASLPGDGKIHLNGTAGPISQKDATETPVEATLAVTSFNPISAGLLDASKGISMDADINAELKSDGVHLSSSGKIMASRLLLARTGTPARVPVQIDYQMTSDRQARRTHVSDIAIHAGSVAAHIQGDILHKPDAPELNLTLSAPNLPIDQVESLLPVFGVRLPTGSTLQGGTLSANLSVIGPVSGSTITGPVEIDNTNLEGFDLGSRIQGLARLAGAGNGTKIQVIRTKVSSNPQSTDFADIYGNLPQLGTATGSGTVLPDGSLNFKMVAKLNSSNVVGAVANQATNAVSGFLGGFLGSKPKPVAGGRGIPITITGTASNPTIRADVMQMLR